MSVLVVYFSRTGTTRRLAGHLAFELDGEAVPIVERRSRLGWLGYHRSAIEAAARLAARIEPLACDPAAYDLVLIGTPVWAWHLSSPVRAFARRHARDLRRVAFFCTMGGAGAAAVFAELEALLGRRPLATLALTTEQVEHLSRPDVLAQVRAFVHPLKSQEAAARLSRAAEPA